MRIDLHHHFSKLSVKFDPIVIRHEFPQEEAPPHFEWTIGPTVNVNAPPMRRNPLDVVLLDNQKTTASINPKDDRGGPATLDGAPTWSADDGGAFVTLTPAADGLSCEIVTTGTETPAGTQVTVTVEGDADMSSGSQPISDVLNITVNGSAAVGLGLSTTPPVHI